MTDTVNTEKLKTREQMNPAYMWDLTELYPDDAAWEAAYEQLTVRLQEVSRLKGTMSRDAASMYRVFRTCDELECSFERLYVYANLKYHQDMGEETTQRMSGKAQTLQTVCMDALSFIEPELMAMPEETITSYLATYEPLQLYTRRIRESLRQRAHILSEEQEQMLAKAAELGQAPQQIYMAYNNADIDLGTIRDEHGAQVPLTHGNYTTFLESSDRRVRRDAFTHMYKVYEKHKNMMAATFTANLKQDLFFAGMRHFDSTLAAALDGGNIPVAVYTQLIEAVHEKLPAMYRYVALRKKVLGVEELHMYDVYVPMLTESGQQPAGARNLDEPAKASAPGRVISYEEAKKMVLEGLSVLGDDYLQLLKQGFSDGWIDVYENQGKRSGAYSWGAYGTHPYVLMNYSGNLNAVFTLAHEMGHALHSYYSNQNQPYVYAGYRIFVAEVASTCNEALLIRYLTEHARDDQEKAYLINYFLDQCKGTIYRQTMFAEFEQLTHEKLQAEGSIPTQTLCNIYAKLNHTYFGDDMALDPEIACEWMRIPHFYTPFYVYQYATGFSAAIAIATKILAGEEGIVEKYKKFLSMGCSEDPIELLKVCGVDMTRKDPVEQALSVFEAYVAELETLLL